MKLEIMNAIENLRSEVLAEKQEQKLKNLNEIVASFNQSMIQDLIAKNEYKVADLYKLISKRNKPYHDFEHQFLLTAKNGILRMTATTLESPKTMVLGACNQDFQGVVPAKNFKNTLALLTRKKYDFTYRFETIENYRYVGCLYLENKTMNFELMFYLYSADNFPYAHTVE
jgi:hypothetical protein